MKAQIQCHCPHIARNCLPLFFTLRSTLLSYLAHTVLFYHQYYLTKDTSIILSARSSPQKQTHNAESALWKFHALSIPYHKYSLFRFTCHTYYCSPPWLSQSALSSLQKQSHISEYGHKRSPCSPNLPDTAVPQSVSAQHLQCPPEISLRQNP